MKVIIRGPLLSVTGYGSHARQVWAWARSKGWDLYAEIVPWGMCTYYVNPDAEGGMIGDIMRSSSPLPQGEKADLSFQIQLPDEWTPTLARKNIGITAGVEADRCSDKWITACKTMDKVVVPSEYSKLAFLNGGLEPEKIVNIPESITRGFEQTENYKEMKEKIDSLDTSFNFLMFGQITSSNVLTDRKNTFNCLKWLCDELKDDKDAGIIIKTNMGRMTKQDRSYTNLMVKKVLSRVRKGKYPKVYVFHGLMDKDELGAIYDNENVKALCAPTRGEGWGLPILDAAASGLPVIATNSTGHMDFMKSVKFLEVESTPVEVPAQMVDGRIWVTGAKWAHPLENSFKERVRKFRKSSSKPKEWAESSAKKINSKFSAESVMSIYDEVLKEYVNES